MMKMMLRMTMIMPLTLPAPLHFDCRLIIIITISLKSLSRLLQASMLEAGLDKLIKPTGQTVHFVR